MQATELTEDNVYEWNLRSGEKDVPIVDLLRTRDSPHTRGDPRSPRDFDT